MIDRVVRGPFFFQVRSFTSFDYSTFPGTSLVMNALLACFCLTCQVLLIPGLIQLTIQILTCAHTISNWMYDGRWALGAVLTVLPLTISKKLCLNRISPELTRCQCWHVSPGLKNPVWVLLSQQWPDLKCPGLVRTERNWEPILGTLYQTWEFNLGTWTLVILGSHGDSLMVRLKQV